jgi:hypothetical protein
MPKPRDLFPVEGSGYPFPIFGNWAGADGVKALVSVLPPRDELFGILDSFQKRGQACSFPHTPDQVTRDEVERFLSDPELYGQSHPDMLALIFMTLATGLQMGEWDRQGGQWAEGSMERTTKSADIYRA